MLFGMTDRDLEKIEERLNALSRVVRAIADKVKLDDDTDVVARRHTERHPADGFCSSVNLFTAGLMTNLGQSRRHRRDGMRRTVVSAVAFVAVLIVTLPRHSDAQTATPTNGRVDRVLDVSENVALDGFGDFAFFLPNSTETFAVYAQWSNSGVVVVDDLTLLCLYGPDGTAGTEDDDITISTTRAITYRVRPGRLWYTTTVRGQRCFVVFDFQHKDQYDLSARASFNILIGELGATEGTWPDVTSLEMYEIYQRMQQLRSGH